MDFTLLLALALRFIACSASSTTQKALVDNDLQQDAQLQELTRSWGQYSLWFSVPSEIPADIPLHCNVTFAQVLSRHGARYPTWHKSVPYNITINKIHENATQCADTYAFLKDYQYALGTDELTVFGQRELYNSGVNFYNRYRALSRDFVPFIRVSAASRVIMSAQNWTSGFHDTKVLHHQKDPDYPYSLLTMSEAVDSNNTLHHGLCAAFDRGPFGYVAAAAKAEWASVFVPAIEERLNSNLPGANLNASDVINIMDLCPYNTVASPNAIISPFCNLFTMEEWQQYGYYQSLDKFYGFGSGNYLGPTQGVGYVNELIARLTEKPVIDHTSTNRTLDSDPNTFPLGRRLYADFGHDNDMIGVFFALGLYNSTKRLKNTTLETVEEMKGYSAAYTVPFAARAYIEKLRCLDGPDEEMVRVIVNDRVLPLETCGGDHLGRCSLTEFVEGLSFARQGGHWDEC